MSAYHTITDASGRSVADHAARLGNTLDTLAARVQDAIAVAVGTAVDGAVQAAVRAALADLLGTTPADRIDPVPGLRPLLVVLGRDRTTVGAAVITTRSNRRRSNRRPPMSSTTSPAAGPLSFFSAAGC